jgi:methionyl-tRNA formyltransferase
VRRFGKLFCKPPRRPPAPTLLMREPLKIAYFGLPLGALLLAHDGHRLGPIVLAPVEAPGRRRLGAAFPRLLDASELGGDLEEKVDEALRVERPDLLVSWFWTRKLPPRWLALPRGALGVHPSLLPRHRGRNPYYWSIDSGDAETGVTVHRLEEEYDTGRILGSRSIAVGERDAWQLARALDRPSLSLLREMVARLARGEPVAELEQDPTRVTWAPEPTGDELRVDFGWTTERALRRIRALSPIPGVALSVEGVDLFLTRAEAARDYLAALLPGEAHISEDLTVRTADGAVRVTRAFFPELEEEGATAAEVVYLLKRLSQP